MQNVQRKERDRGRRRALIVATARRLAESEGWDAVTTRRLAEQIEYSQPVLYSHFPSKDAIVAAVAVEGFAELATAIRARIPLSAAPAEAVQALATTYLAFAAHHPALYAAMFALHSELAFAADVATPAPLHTAFAAMRDVLTPFAEDPDVFTEVVWAALHGLVTLAAAGRLPPAQQDRRVEVLVDRLVSGPSSG